MFNEFIEVKSTTQLHKVGTADLEWTSGDETRLKILNLPHKDFDGTADRAWSLPAFFSVLPTIPTALFGDPGPSGSEI